MSWLEDHLPESVKAKLCDPEVPKAPESAPVQQSVPSSATQWSQNPDVRQSISTNFPSAMPNIGATPASVLSSAVASILSDLRTKTDFDATPVGQQLKQCIDALSDTGLSDEQKSKTAMKLSHQSPANVVSVLQGLQSVLAADKQKFDATMSTATTMEVDNRQSQSAQLQSQIEAAESQINAMRQQKTQIDNEIQEKQNKILNARANYLAASEARRTELAEMISHYQSIPEGN